MGDNALALARELGDRDLGAAGRARRRGRHLLPGARRARALPGPAGVAAGGRRAGSPSALLALVLRRRGVSSLRRTAGGAALAAAAAGPRAAGRPGAVVAAGRGAPRLRLDARPVAAGLVPAGRRRAGRRRRAALVRAAAPADRRRRRWPSAGWSGWRCWPPSWPRSRRAAPTWPPGRRWPVRSPGIVAALDVVPGGPGGRRAGRRAVAVVVLAPTVALFFPALGPARPAPRRPFVATMLARRAAARRSSCSSPTRTPRAGPPAAAAVVPVTAVVARRRLRRSPGSSSTASTPTTRCPASSSTCSTPTRAGLVGQHGGRARARTPRGYVGGRGALPADFPYLAGARRRTGPPPSPPTCRRRRSSASRTRSSASRREITVRVTPQRTASGCWPSTCRVDGGTVAGGRVAGRAVPEGALGEDRLLDHLPRAAGGRPAGAFTVEGDGAGATCGRSTAATGSTACPASSRGPRASTRPGTHSSDLVVVAGDDPAGLNRWRSPAAAPPPLRRRRTSRIDPRGTGGAVDRTATA